MAARALVRIGLVAGGLLARAGSAEALSFPFSEVARDTLTDAEGAAFAAAWPGWLGQPGWQDPPNWHGQPGCHSQPG